MASVDFSGLRAGKTMAEVAQGLTLADVRRLTDELFDEVESLAADVTDADVTFEPTDPHLKEGDLEGAWTFAHVIAHLTAGVEETACLGSIAARGILFEGRLRYEVPWQELRTADQVLARLVESRRMTKAHYDAWPDEPHLDITVTPIPRFGPLNALGRTLLGLYHIESHLEQLREIRRQSRAGA